ncbi:hypothetical protein J1N35_037173 [Gossypium stocksii]|uniref:Uncharacterized protein n=1 Tax=Gossypium stocksii TaxID=47602 RepID=A0A9D3UK89_9ROSI|nr:hypothetical protein J1N35_037173 [Gossypium stocksii]
MAPRKQQCITQAQSNIDFNHFYNLKVERFFLKLSGCSFIQERGFDATMSACDDIWDLNGWPTPTPLLDMFELFPSLGEKGTNNEEENDDDNEQETPYHKIMSDYFD